MGLKKMVSENRIRFFEDINALKIMLLLYRDNPDVSFDEIQKQLRMNRNDLTAKLAELISAELVKVKDNDVSQFYTLSENARMSFNRIDVCTL